MTIEAGTPIESVVLEIDYAIIQHFSQHLYGSPNKAVEELVANGFDAFANDVYVYVPGGTVEDRVLVWDDGESMDVGGLKALWQIARSPKNDGTDRVRTSRGRTRKIIGKFGIGKLASYAVGSRISHLCKQGDTYLLVGVDYRDVEEELPAEGPAARYESPIYQLTDAEARTWVEAVLSPDAAAFRFFEEPTFTLAVVDQLRDVPLPPGRLGWVLGNAMPLRPDFRVWVNDVEVESKLGRNATTTWDLSQERLRDAVASLWSSARDRGDVVGELVWDEIGGVPRVTFPTLGTISAQISLFERSLQREGETRDERSYGFFVMVRDRLLNVEDDKLFLPDPSFGTFYRSQFIVRADGLDASLLASRSDLRIDERTVELTILQRALYRTARGELERQDAARAAEIEYSSPLPTNSRELYREPLVSLILRRDPAGLAAFDLSAARTLRESLEESDPIASLDLEAGAFRINVSHPFFVSLRNQLGTGVRAERAFRAFEALAVSERLLEGYLLDMGMSEADVDRILSWREELLRTLGQRYELNADQAIADVRNTSARGNAPFEMALARLFGVMGFVATRKGAPGMEDVLVVGPTGETSVTFTVEGKGSVRPVPNDAAEVGAAAAHARAAGASAAIVVAREFAGMSREGDAAILRECEAVSTPDLRVSVVDVETLIELYQAVDKFYYPLEVILPVLAEIETPTAKRVRIASLASPVEDFDYRALLEHLWARQQEEAAGDVVAYRHVWQTGYRNTMTIEEFTGKLAALDTLARGLIRLNPDTREVTLLQSPDLIAARIATSLAA